MQFAQNEIVLTPVSLRQQSVARKTAIQRKIGSWRFLASRFSFGRKRVSGNDGTKNSLNYRRNGPRWRLFGGLIGGQKLPRDWRLAACVNAQLAAPCRIGCRQRY